MLAAWSCIRSGAWRYCLAVFLTLVNGYVLTVLLVIGKVIWPFLEYNSLPIELLVFGSLVVLISFNTLLHVWALMGNKSSCALALRSRWGLLRW